jgi:ATP-dependent DNA ligase
VIEAAVMALPARSCLIDSEAIVNDEADLAVFELFRRRGLRRAADQAAQARRASQSANT